MEVPIAGGAAIDEANATLVEFSLKAIREAKVHTIWTSPNAAYEQATAHNPPAAFARRFTREKLQGAGS